MEIFRLPFYVSWQVQNEVNKLINCVRRWNNHFYLGNFQLLDRFLTIGIEHDLLVSDYILIYLRLFTSSSSVFTSFDSTSFRWVVRIFFKTTGVLQIP